MMPALYAVLALLLVIDWQQTLRIAREPEHWYEAWNPILPKHPSVAQVHTWFAAVTLLGAVALWLLPDSRLYLCILGGFVELAAVVNNFRIGLKP